MVKQSGSSVTPVAVQLGLVGFAILAGDKISETPTPVLREIVNEIKNSHDIKYQEDNAK